MIEVRSSSFQRREASLLIEFYLGQSKSSGGGTVIPYKKL
jgi:hypothetical protein